MTVDTEAALILRGMDTWWCKPEGFRHDLSMVEFARLVGCKLYPYQETLLELMEDWLKAGKLVLAW